MKWKKIVSGIITMAMALGTMASMAFAPAMEASAATVIAPGSITTEAVVLGKGSDGKAYTLNGTQSVKIYNTNGSVKERKTITFHNWPVDALRATDKAATSALLYCIEAGTHFPSGGLSSVNAENIGYFSLKKLSNATLFRAIGEDALTDMWISLIYGWQPGVALPAALKNAGLNTIDWYYAEQVILWEYQQGYRTAWDEVQDNIYARSIKGRPAKTAYDDILRHIGQHKMIPSFMRAKEEQARTETMVWDGSKFSVTLTDTNGYLDNIDTGNSSITCTKSGNKYTFSTTGSRAASSGTTLIGGYKDLNLASTGLLVWGKPGKQTMCSGASDPVKMYLKLKTLKPELNIVKTGKTASDYVGKVFDVKQGGKTVLTMTTDANGKATGSLPGYGDYTITERNADNYTVTIDNTQGSSYDFSYAAADGASKTININNTQKDGTLEIRKTSEDGIVSGFTFRVQGNGLDLTGTTNADGLLTTQSKLRFVNGWGDDNRRDALYEYGMSTGEILAAMPNGGSGYEVYSDQKGAVLAANAKITANLPANIRKISGKTFYAQLVPRGGIGVDAQLNTVDHITALSIREATQMIGMKRGDDLTVWEDQGVYTSPTFFNQYDVDGDNQITQKDIDLMQAALDGTGIFPAYPMILPSGSYTITEQNVPTRYIQPLAKTVVVKPNQTTVSYFYNRLKTTSIRILKNSEDGVVNGIKFHIVGPDGFDQTITTDETGEIITKAKLGAYTVTELEVAGRYVTPQPQTITLTKDGETGTVTFTNILKPGYAKIIKTSEDGKVSGMQFYISGVSDTGAVVNQNVTTGADGTIAVQLMPGQYTVHEVLAANGIYVAQPDQSVTVTWENAQTNPATVTFRNILKKFRLTVTKRDAETDTAQADADLDGAVYGLYDTADQLVEQYTVKDGGFVTGEVAAAAGLYLQEITPPTGYQLDDTKYPLETAPEDLFAALTTITLTVEEDVIKGSILIHKFMGLDGTTPEVGAVFQVWLKRAGSYAAADESVRDTITTDQPQPAEETATGEPYPGGQAGTKLLPYGTYVVHQVSGDVDHALIADFEVEINEHGKIYEYTKTNSPIIGSVTVTKIDADYPDNKLTGAEFTVWKDVDKDGKYTDRTDTLVGKLVETKAGVYTLGNLYLGRYLIQETKAPAGFVPDTGVYAFAVTMGGQVVTLENVEGKGFANSPAKGTVQVTKVDRDYPNNWLTGAAFTVAKDVDKDGKYTECTDIIMGNLQENETVPGEYALTGLRVGSYLLWESIAPSGFVLDETVYAFAITKDGETVNVENEAGKGFVNSPATGKLELTKTDISTGKVIPNTEISIYADEDGKPGDKLASKRTDANGKVVFDRLRVGRYWYAESGTADGYVLDETPAMFEIKENGQIVKAEMTNQPEPVSTPDTGDSGMLPMLPALLVLAGGAAVMICRRQKRV